MEKSKKIFNNEIPEHVYRKACKSKDKLIKKFGDDSNTVYHLCSEENTVIGKSLGVRNLKLSDKPEKLDEKALIVGNIRMGFGHYRISMAIASAAHALGYTPYWFDLNSFSTATCGKIISHQNALYSMGSRWSQKYPLFNKLYWEPLNSEGFRQLSYNAVDQKNAELMTPVFADIPKDIPFVATHVWPAQAAVHAGLTNVVNVIPDNWQMALHLAEGSVHTVQTPSALLGYKTLRGMDKNNQLNPMPADSIVMTGQYIDHELVSNIEADCDARIKRIKNGQEKRYLITVGGAGAQKELFVGIIKKLIPEIKAQKAALMINVGDHKNVWDELVESVPEMKELTTEHFDDFPETEAFCEKYYTESMKGIHAFYDKDIFAAVYSTNLLMRICDALVTKPSELAFYPVPKIMIKRVGGHEAWGAIRAAEVGDGTFECETLPQATAMIDLFQNDNTVIQSMCDSILKAKSIGIYDGAYNVVKLAEKQK